MKKICFPFAIFDQMTRQQLKDIKWFMHETFLPREVQFLKITFGRLHQTINFFL